MTTEQICEEIAQYFNRMKPAEAGPVSAEIIWLECEQDYPALLSLWDSVQDWQAVAKLPDFCTRSWLHSSIEVTGPLQAIQCQKETSYLKIYVNAVRQERFTREGKNVMLESPADKGDVVSIAEF